MSRKKRKTDEMYQNLSGQKISASTVVASRCSNCDITASSIKAIGCSNCTMTASNISLTNCSNCVSIGSNVTHSSCSNCTATGSNVSFSNCTNCTDTSKKSSSKSSSNFGLNNIVCANNIVSGITSNCVIDGVSIISNGVVYGNYSSGDTKKTFNAKKSKTGYQTETVTVSGWGNSSTTQTGDGEFNAKLRNEDFESKITIKGDDLYIQDLLYPEGTEIRNNRIYVGGKEYTSPGKVIETGFEPSPIV